MLDFEKNFSRGVLIQLAIVAVLVAALLAASLDFLTEIYLVQQLTRTGYLINGGILGLFLLGLARVVTGLARYMREEQAIQQFAAAQEAEVPDPAAELSPRRLVVQRYETVLKLSRQSAPIHHAALASALVARESTTISLPKFINNILILTGVFGTIVSLSIALVGASNVIGGPSQELGDMSLVIHGMSTALSTTITAIVAYLLYGYFYLKLTDAQTHVLSGIEQVTSMHLLPRYAHTSDNLVHQVAGLVKKLQEVADGMRSVQFDYAESGSQLHNLLASLNLRVKPVSEDLKNIKHTLREGFRLRDTSD